MNKKMRRMVTLSLSAALTCLPVALRAQTSDIDSGLAEMFRLAEQHNATLHTLQSSLLEARAGIETAKTARLPEVSANLSFSYLGNARIWNRHFGEGTKAAMPHYGNNFLLKASQVIYAGGAIDGSIRLAEQNAEMKGLAIEEEVQKVRFLLTGLYLQLHSLKNAQEVYHTNAALAEEMIALMRKRREQGVALRNDVTRYELQLQEMQLGATTMSDRQSIVRKQLATALGTDSVSVRLLGEQAFDDNQIRLETEEMWQQRALANHKGLQQSSLGIEISKTKETLEKAERLPKVALVAENHLDGPITIEVPPINKNLNYWFVGVGVSYNFSALYKNKRHIRQAELATSLATDRLTEAKAGVSDAIHAAYVNLGTARTELETRQKSVQLAAENYDVVQKRYQNGMAIVTDLTDAANMKLDAELALVNARINLVYAYYNLKYAAGCL